MSGWVAPSPPSRGFSRGNTSPSNTPSRTLTQSPRASHASLVASSPILPAVAPHAYRSSSHVEGNKHARRTSEADSDDATSQFTASPIPSGRIASRVSAAEALAQTACLFLPLCSLRLLLPPPSLRPPPPRHVLIRPTGRTTDAVHECHACSARFSLFLRKHHCRLCGLIFCDGCSKGRRRVRGSGDEAVRVCDRCDATMAREEDDDRHRNDNNAHQPSIQPPPQHTPSPPPPPTSSSTSSPRQPHASFSISQHKPSHLNTSPPSLSSLLDTACGAGVDGAEQSALVAALVHELLCAEEVVRNARLVREEMEAMVMQLVAEIIEREGAEARDGLDNGGNMKTRAEAAAVDDEVAQLRRKVEELQLENARLRRASQ